MARRLITPKGKVVQLEGLPQLQANISEIISRPVGERVKKIHMNAALILRDSIREYTPILQKPHKGHVAGLLRSAIFAAYGSEDKPDVLVGANRRIAPHAWLVEYGSSKMAPQPYMRTGLTVARGACVAAIADGYRILLIENGTVPLPSSPYNREAIPLATNEAIKRVRDRAKAAYLKKRG